MQSPVYMEDFNDIEDIYGDLSFLKFPNLTSLGKEGKKLMTTNQNAKVLFCQFLGQPESYAPELCQLFQRSITSNGFGYSFNTADFWSIYQNNSFMWNFSKIMKPKESNILISTMSSATNSYHNFLKNDDVKYIRSSGPQHSLTFVLQSDDYPFTEAQDPFSISIHDPIAIPDLRKSSFKV